MQFLWGAATSAHQTEGGLENDWTRWEERHSHRWSSPSLLDRIVRRIRGYQPPPSHTDPNSYVSGQATDFYNRYERDIELADRIGLNALRFSLEWSRVEPEPGEFSETALEHYGDVLDEARERGLEPVVTLWHFTHPQWFVEEVGWHDGRAPEVFERYVDRVVGALGEDVDLWVTMNEPMAYLTACYLFDNFPPERTRWRQLPAAYRHVVDAQQRASAAIQERDPTTRLGISVSAGCFEPYTEHLLNEWAAEGLRQLERDRFLRRVTGTLDWLGVNYYYHYRTDLLFRNLLEDDPPRSDLGWPLSPEGLGNVVERMGEFCEPVVVTEHGLADQDDEHRPWYIRESIEALDRARSTGTAVNGYFHWSLTDCLEWHRGRWPRFGLVEIDYDDGLARSLRESATTYRSLIEERDWSADW